MLTTSDDRAVSDVVGFVLSFAVIVASVALVATAGFGQLEELRDTEQIRSAEAGMNELAETFSFVIGRNDTQRRAGLALSGGNFEVGSSELTVVASDGGTTVLDTDVPNVLTLRHTIDDVPMVYEGGAVFYGNGNIVTSRPAVSCRDGVAIVSVLTFAPDPVYLSRGEDRIRFPASEGTNQLNKDIDISAAKAISNEGRLTLQVRGVENEVEIIDLSGESDDTVTVTYADAATPAGWTQLRDRRDTGWNWSGDPDTNKMRCQGVDRVMVRQTKVTLALGQ